MKSTGLKLTLVATLIVAVLVGGAAVVLGAGAQQPSGDAFSAPMAAGGPAGRLALSGPWVEADDPADVGARDGWRGGQFPGKLVDIPYVANAAHVTGAAGVAAYRGGIAWYRTTLTAPRTGSYALRFESVHHVATVWLDGRQIGTHTGAYLPFEVGLRLREGVPHTLVVRADFRCPTLPEARGLAPHVVQLRRHQPRGDAAAAGAQRGRGAGGAHAALPRRGGRRRRRATVDNRAATTRALQLARHAAARARRSLDLPARADRAARRRKRVTTRVVIKDPRLWQPGSPNLYALHLGVAGEGAWDDARRPARGLALRARAAAQRQAPAAARRVDQRGRRRPRRRPDRRRHGPRRARAEGGRRERDARAARAVAAAAGAPGPRRDPGLAGRRPGRRARRLDLEHAARWRTPRASASGSACARSSCTRASSPGTSPTRSPATATTRRRSPTSATWRASCTARIRAGSSPSTSGAPTRRAVPGKIYKNVDAVALTNYIGWYEGADESRAQIASRLHSTRPRLHADCSRRRSCWSPSSAPRPTPRNADRRTRRLRLPVLAAAPPHRHLPRPAPALRHVGVEPPGLRRRAHLRRRLHLVRRSPTSTSNAASTPKASSTTRRRPKPAAAAVRRRRVRQRTSPGGELPVRVA